MCLFSKINKQMTITDDNIIIQQALRGEQQGYALMVKKYEQMVFTLALRVVKNREEAHEVAQDAFLKYLALSDCLYLCTQSCANQKA
jgi:DNA-directed RNA polymerase specialized sigma24 family protein